MRRVAILVVGFKRPDLLSRLLGLLHEGDIKNVVVSIDSDNLGNINEDIKMLSKSKYIEFDWRFRTKNLGVGFHVPTAVGEVLEEYDACFILEDDVLVSIEALKSATKRLEEGLPKNCLTVGLFGALPSNLLLKSLLGVNRWRKTEFFSAWAWGTDRENWEKYEHILEGASIERTLANSTSWQRKNPSSKRRWLTRLRKVSSSPNFAWDFQMQYATYRHDGYHLLPFYRSADNIGFGDSRSTNTKSNKPRWYLGPTNKCEILQDEVLNSLRVRILQFIDSVTWAGDNNLIALKNRFFRKLKKI